MQGVSVLVRDLGEFALIQRIAIFVQEIAKCGMSRNWQFTQNPAGQRLNFRP